MRHIRYALSPLKVGNDYVRGHGRALRTRDFQLLLDVPNRNQSGNALMILVRSASASCLPYSRAHTLFGMLPPPTFRY